MSVENSEISAKIDKTVEPVGQGRETTYVEAARQGRHQYWSYLLGLAVIAICWLLGGFATAMLAFILVGPEGAERVSRLDLGAFGPVGGFVVTMTNFPFLLLGVLFAVRLVHGRRLRTLITARRRISVRRVAQGFAAWIVAWCLVLGLGQYLFFPDAFSVTPDLASLALFVPVALVLTAIQTTTEELLYRGYVVQGASVICANRIFLALVSATVFTLPYLLRPSAWTGGWVAIFLGYFVAGGLFWAVVSLVDGTTELAIGGHFAHNIASVLLINTTGAVFATPALIKVGETAYPAFALLLVMALFLMIIYVVSRRGRKAVEAGPRPAAKAAAER